MLWRLWNRRRQGSWNADTHHRSFSLQIVLWTLWTLVVVGVGLFSWYSGVLAQRPINTLGLVIHCLVAGVIGLVVLTVIEMHLEPWRFVDTA